MAIPGEQVSATATNLAGASQRLAFIDWARGAAAFVMLQGHTFHSFTDNSLRPKGPYQLSQLAGGLPPAVFLFLTGVTFAFLMHSQERKALPGFARLTGALKRARYLFTIAVLFRLQLYLLGYPTSPASELLRVDILNCMGFAMLVLAPLALLKSSQRIRWSVSLGLFISFFSPVMAQVHLPLPTAAVGYLIPSYTAFAFFPWAAFLAFGITAGTLLRTLPASETDRMMLWMLGVGCATIFAAHYFSSLPYTVYDNVDFWLDGPGLTLGKLGVVLLLLALAYLWVGRAGAGQAGADQAGVDQATTEHIGFFRLFGTNSLLVYWVHIELVYGRWFGIWKEKLNYWQVLAFTTALVALMYVLCLKAKDWKGKIQLHLPRLDSWKPATPSAPEPRP